MSKEMTIDYGADVGAGGDLTTKDVGVPFIKIAQKMSSATSSTEVKPGQIYNTATNNIYERIDIISCYYVRGYDVWIPMEKGGGFAGFTVDTPNNSEAVSQLLGSCTRNNLGKQITPEGNEVMETGKHMVLYRESETENDWESAMITMSSTQLKASRSINSIVQSMSKTHPRFAHIFRLGTIKQGTEPKIWWVWTVEYAGLVEDVDLYSSAKLMCEQSSSILIPNNTGNTAAIT